MKNFIQVGATQWVDPQEIVVVQWNSRSISPQVILRTGQAYNATEYRPGHVPPNLEVSLETQQSCINSLLTDIRRSL